MNLELIQQTLFKVPTICKAACLGEHNKYQPNVCNKSLYDF